MDAPKPFLISAQRAADIICRKIERGADRIVVPWQFAVIGAIASFIPRSLVAAILRRV
jgi:short-subunit dehydrogenase